MLEWEELVKPLWQQSYVRMIEQVMGKFREKFLSPFHKRNS
ncbi:hypothetical protein MtrunA17_Chr7g0217501 [Medicago truncatula]|uniref:Uncharacterized protein n=1 Tax=Medicago truncatula TaxID=3880 RepID=A0A396GUS0_MEDTR|nr:hypothetical protein MtrunA17_Chr7g0217501 [Medicago truncatula]